MIPENGNAKILCGHSQKLTVTSGLINKPEGEALSVTKTSMYIFWTLPFFHINNDKVQVVDANNVHSFRMENGRCTCK